MGFYRDIETREILTGEMLKGEFETRKADGTTDAETVGEYIESCLTRNNGTLDPVFTCREFVEDLYFNSTMETCEEITIETAQAWIDGWKAENRSDGWNIPENLTAQRLATLWNQIID